MKHRWLLWPALCIVLAIAACFLWTEHRAHFLGALPLTLLVLGCALMHVLIHRSMG